MNSLEYETAKEQKIHGKPDFPFNIYPCSIPLDFTSVPPHWHSDMELVYIKKGQGVVSIDLVSYPVNDGDILLIPPGHLHSIDQRPGCIMEYENIIFQLSLLMAPGEDLCSEHFFLPMLQGRMDLPAHLSPSLPFYSQAACCLNAIDTLSSQWDATSALGIKGKLFELFYFLFCSYPNASLQKQPSKSLDTLKLILKHVETHYQEKLSISDMAGISGFSCSHFMKFFKQHMGISFIDYLNDYRLNMAARMLSSSADPIVAVAGEAGFENLSYFNRLFKRKYHMTPSRYRQKSRPTVPALLPVP